jgi:hypothetical protein
MGDLMSPPASSTTGGDASTTPKTRRKGQADTPGTPDYSGNGTLLGFPGMTEFIMALLPKNAKITAPPKPKNKSSGQKENVTPRHGTQYRTEPGEQAKAIK